MWNVILDLAITWRLFSALNVIKGGVGRIKARLLYCDNLIINLKKSKNDIKKLSTLAS